MSGSIVNITVSQNHQAEHKSQAAFESLQTRILDNYGLHSPATPELRLRNATQTSFVLEWDPIQLATSTLRSLSLYRNGSKVGNIPRPMDQLATKISGLAIDTEYSFYLVLRTSGGTYTSSVLKIKTHKMTDLHGIVVTPGVLPGALRESLDTAIERIGAKIADTVRIDTTHFVCTEGRGRDWERAMEMSIPVVRPEWVEGCEREGKIVGVRGYYLNANPKDRQIGSNPSMSSSQQAPAAAKSPPPSQPSPANKPAPEAQEPDDRPSEDEVAGEPGPEVPPTPPQKDVPLRPAGEDESEEDGEEVDEKGHRNDESPVSPVSDEDQKEPKRPAAVQDEKDMDEVPL